MSRGSFSALHAEDRRESFTTGRCRRLAPPRPRRPGRLDSGSLSDSDPPPRRGIRVFPPLVSSSSAVAVSCGWRSDADVVRPTPARARMNSINSFVDWSLIGNTRPTYSPAFRSVFRCDRRPLSGLRSVGFKEPRRAAICFAVIDRIPVPSASFSLMHS